MKISAYLQSLFTVALLFAISVTFAIECHQTQAGCNIDMVFEGYTRSKGKCKAFDNQWISYAEFSRRTDAIGECKEQ